MLAVDSGFPDGVMESITEQDLVEHCVIVQPSSNTPPNSISLPDHTSSEDEQQHPSPSPQQPPPTPSPTTTTTTTTRIVYHHSARLGGQLVTVLTHGPPRQHAALVEESGIEMDGHGHHPHCHSEEEGGGGGGARLVVVVPQTTQHSGGLTSLPLHRLHSLHLKPMDHHPTVLVHTSPHTELPQQSLSSQQTPQDKEAQEAEDLSTSTTSHKQPLSLATLTVIVPPSHHHHHHHHKCQEEDSSVQEQEEEEEEEVDHVESMICDGEFRAAMNHHHHHTQLDHHPHHHTHHTHHQVIYPNGRISPSSDYSPTGNGGGGGGGGHGNNNSNAQGHYATLTPLQPLPPISTMTDKFTYAPQSFMGHNGLAMYGTGQYENVKLMSPQSHHYSSPSNGLMQGSPPPQQHYQQQTNSSNGLSPKMSPNSYEGGGGGGSFRGRSEEDPTSPHQQQQHVTFTSLSTTNANNNTNGLSPHESSHSSPPLTAVVIAHR
jgi:hypothetical protein